MAKNKDQHFISAFYLYNFTNEQQRIMAPNGKARYAPIYYYDCRKKCIKERPIDKLAIESYLLSFQNEDGSYNHSLDYKLQEVEKRASNSIRKLEENFNNMIENKLSSIHIDPQIMGDLLDFIVWQIRRHPDLINQLKCECEQYLSEKSLPIQHGKEMALKVVEEIGKPSEYDIKGELLKKNKTILFTLNESDHFITTDKPLVRFNKNKPNGISIKDTEIYFPITSRMFLFLCNNGNQQRLEALGDKMLLKELNTYMGDRASRFIFGPSKVYLEELAKELEIQKNEKLV